MGHPKDGVDKISQDFTRIKSGDSMLSQKVMTLSKQEKKTTRAFKLFTMYRSSDCSFFPLAKGV